MKSFVGCSTFIVCKAKVDLVDLALKYQNKVMQYVISGMDPPTHTDKEI